MNANEHESEYRADDGLAVEPRNEAPNGQNGQNGLNGHDGQRDGILLRQGYGGQGAAQQEATEPVKKWKKISVVEALEARNEDGSYKYGKLLSAKQRFALIKSARAADAKRGADAVEQLEAQLLAGEEIDRKQVEGMFEGRADMVKYRNDALNLYDRIVAKRNSEARADARFKSFVDKQRAEAEAKKQKDADSVFMCDLLDWVPDADPELRKKEYLERRAEIWSRTTGDYARRKKMLDILDGQMNTIEKPAAVTYKKNPAYGAVMETLQKDVFFDREAIPVPEEGDPEIDGRNNEMDAEDQYLNSIARSHIKVEMEQFFMTHPKCSDADAWNAYQKIHDRWMKEEVARMMTVFMNEKRNRGQTISRSAAPIALPAQPEPPAVGTIVGKYRFKGGDPAMQENWEKIK